MYGEETMTDKIKTEELFRCEKCGVPVPDGTGLEIKGQLRRLCKKCLSEYYLSHIPKIERPKDLREESQLISMLNNAQVKFMRVVDTGSDTCPIVVTIENLEMISPTDESSIIRVDVVFDFDPISGNLQKVRARRG
jgi:hypothetical protein